MNRLLLLLFFLGLLVFLLTAIVHAGSPGSQVEPAQLGGFTDTVELATQAGAQPGMYSLRSARSAATSYGNLEELILPSFDYADWYETETGYTGNDTYFGAYALQPVGATLYLGFGTARPAENVGDGALTPRLH